MTFVRPSRRRADRLRVHAIVRFVQRLEDAISSLGIENRLYTIRLEFSPIRRPIVH